ncbi:glycine-rich RNA-binding protein 2-like [Brassica napus]|uniref:glycine-rich RNA-binding protein 2-like n=1 Tax=Brassica napus TaxID=3708 RepID=UPI0006AB6952|nr:glycine-rich RNA-binding protein 2-like [Brassica napus]
MHSGSHGGGGSGYWSGGCGGYGYEGGGYSSGGGGYSIGGGGGGYSGGVGYGGGCRDGSGYPGGGCGCYGHVGGYSGVEVVTREEDEVVVDTVDVEVMRVEDKKVKAMVEKGSREKLIRNII